MEHILTFCTYILRSYMTVLPCNKYPTNFKTQSATVYSTDIWGLVHDKHSKLGSGIRQVNMI